MACRLIGAKQPMMAYCLLDPWEQISMEFESISLQEIAFTENVICRLVCILFRPQCVKRTCWCFSGVMKNVLGAWWRHQMETFSALLALCVGNSPVTGEFPSQRPVAHSVDVFFDLRLNKGLNKQSRRWWFETPSRSLWRHSNGKCAKHCILSYW